MVECISCEQANSFIEFGDIFQCKSAKIWSESPRDVNIVVYLEASEGFFGWKEVYKCEKGWVWVGSLKLPIVL